MLVTSDIEQLALLTGKTAEQITAAIQSEAQEELGLVAKTNELRTNSRGAGVEIGIKQVYEKFGVTGEKTPDAAKEVLSNYFKSSSSEDLTKKEQEIAALKEQISKGDQNTQDAIEYKRKYDTLKSTYEKEKSEYDNKLTEINATIFNKERDNMILSTIPDNTIIERNDLLTLIKSSTNIEKDEHGRFYVKGEDGMPKQDTLGNTLAADQYLKSIISEKYMKKGASDPGGNGGGEGGEKKTFDDTLKELQEKGIDPGSEKGKLALAETL